MNQTVLTLLICVVLPLVLFIALIVMVWKRKRAPKTSEGDYLLVDQYDLPKNVVGSILIAAFVAVCAGIGTINAIMDFDMAKATWGVTVGLGAAFVAFGLATTSSAEAAIAGTGEVRVPAWPLKTGQRTTLRFRRPMKVTEGMGPVAAALVLVETPGNTEHIEVKRIPLDDGGARVENGDLVAAWTLDLPDATNGRDATARRWHHTRWRLEVKVPVGEAEIDTQIDLPIEA